MNLYRHNFDPGVYRLYKDNGDGTGLFIEKYGSGYEPYDIGKYYSTNYKDQSILYSWSQMRKI